MTAAMDAMTGVEEWRELPDNAKTALIIRLADRLAGHKRALWHPYPWQTPPGDIPAHGTWIAIGGRGIGKTEGVTRYVVDHVRGPACDRRVPGGHRIAIVAPTLGDAAESCVHGPSGIRAHDPSVVLRHTVGGSHVRWPSGAEGKLFGASTPDDVERLRSGGNRCLVLLEELAAMRQLGPALDHTAFGLRLGDHPHFVGSTTPKPRRELRDLLARPSTVITRGRTADAWHLDEAVRAELLARYAGTRLGRQELEGELLEDVEGALWTYDSIDAHRVPAAALPELPRIVVAVDPAVSVTETSDEMGLVAVGIGADRHLYVLADRSVKDAGAGAARRVWQLWADLQASAVVYEGNQGKRWVHDVLAQVWAQMQAEGTLPAGAPPLTEVNAVAGKRLRAEPVAAMYELGQVHHVTPAPIQLAGHPGRVFEALEDQMCTWVPESGQSPDRLDALVHACTYLAGRTSAAAVASPAGLTRSAFSAGGGYTPAGHGTRNRAGVR